MGKQSVRSLPQVKKLSPFWSQPPHSGLSLSLRPFHCTKAVSFSALNISLAFSLRDLRLQA